MKNIRYIYLLLLLIYTGTVTLCQEIRSTSGWVCKEINSKYSPVAYDVLTLKNIDTDSSMSFKEESKFKDFERGQIEVKGDFKNLHVDSSSQIKIIAIGLYNKVAKIYYNKSITLNENTSFELLIPVDSKLDSLAVHFLSKGKINCESIQLKTSITEGEFIQGWKEKFLRNDRGGSSIISKLTDLSLTWGLLKYYCAGISKYNVDWDQILIDRIKHIESGEDINMSFNQLIKESKMNLSNIENAETTVLKDLDGVNIDHNWIDKLAVDKEKKNTLLKMLNRYVPFENKYIKTPKEYNNITIKLVEDPIHSNSLPNVYERLLTLFRFHNVIKYYAPYKYTLKDWDKKLTELIPIFIGANTSNDYGLALLRLNASISDGHSPLPISPIQALFYINKQPVQPLPVHIVKHQNSFYVSNVDSLFSLRTNITVGDEIIQINGLSMKDRYEKIAYYIADERREMKDYFINNNKMLDFIAISDSVIFQVKNKNNSTENKAFIYEKEYYKSSFKVTNSETQTIKLARQNSGFFHVKKDILYINPTYLKDSFDAELLKSSSKLVIDLREYPKMNLDISNLVPPNVPFSLLQRSTQVPGYLESFFMHTPVDAVYDKGKKIIVLISESSISNAEFMSLQLKTNKNTILVGRNTAGANGNVLQIPVVGGGSGVNFRYSSIRVLFPSKKETQIIGIEPDIFVENSMDELIEKKDLIFEKAIELLK